MRSLNPVLVLAGFLGCSGLSTPAPPDAHSTPDGDAGLGDLAQPAAPCRAAQGLSGTPIMGLCVDMDQQPAPDLSKWNLMNPSGACTAGWSLSGSGPGAVLRPVNYNTKAGPSYGCGFRLPNLEVSAWSMNKRLRIAIEYAYQPGSLGANNYAVIELVGVQPASPFYPTSTVPGQPAHAHFDVDVARLPSMGSLPIEFRLWQTANLDTAPTWEIRSLAVLVE